MLYLRSFLSLTLGNVPLRNFIAVAKRDIPSFYPLRIHWWIFPNDEESQQKVSYDFILILCSALFQKEVLFAQHVITGNINNPGTYISVQKLFP